MLNEYSEQKPLKALLFHSGVEEEPYFTENKKDYLLWVGRLDQDKAPHYAVLAAEKLGMKIKVLGKTIYQPEYFEKNMHIFSLPHVEMIGVVFGKEKMKLISEARCAVYTIDKNYYEAGAGVLGEILSSGVPIAGMSWSGIDAICEAVNNKNFGEVALIKKDDSEEQIIEKLSQTIINCLNIDSHETFKLGSHKYNPKFLITKLFEMVEEYKNK